MKIIDSWQCTIGTKAFFSKEKDRIIVVSNNIIEIWDFNSQKKIAETKFDEISLIASISYHKEIDSVLLCSKNEMQILSFGKDKKLKKVETKTSIIGAELWDTNTILIINVDKISVWDIEMGEIVNQFCNPFANELRSFEVSPHKNRIITGTKSGSIGIWEIEDIRTCKDNPINGYLTINSPITSIASDYDSKIIVLGYEKGNIRIEREAGPISEFSAHSQTVKKVIINKNYNRLFSYSSDSSIKEWDSLTLKLVSSININEPILDIIVKEDFLFFIDDKGKITIIKWNDNNQGNTNIINTPYIIKDEVIEQLSYINDIINLYSNTKLVLIFKVIQIGLIYTLEKVCYVYPNLYLKSLDDLINYGAFIEDNNKKEKIDLIIQFYETNISEIEQKLSREVINFKNPIFKELKIMKSISQTFKSLLEYI